MAQGSSHSEDGVLFNSRRFLLDEDVLPGSMFSGTIPHLNNGRSIARNGGGAWFCCFTIDRKERPLPVRQKRDWQILLAVSNKPVFQGSAFPEPVILVGESGSLFSSGTSRLGSSSLVIDPSDRLHLFYEQDEDIFHLHADASSPAPRERLADRSAWSGPEAVAEGASLGDIFLDTQDRLRLVYTRRGVLYQLLLGEGGEQKICDGGIHPSAHLDGDGTIHLAFERDRRIFYLRQGSDGLWTDSTGTPGPEMVAYFCSSWPSLATTTDGKIVIAYQGEGKTDLKQYPPLYAPLRVAGGSTVSYAVHNGEKWSIHDFLRSSEILLKRRPHHRHPQADPTFLPFMEEFWRPSLSVDPHGVVWMFYVNSTRRHIYWSRFQGKTFGTHHEARGPYDVMTRLMCLQKETSSRLGIGYLTFASNQVYFDVIQVSEYKSRDRRRIVFLDHLEVDHMIDLEPCIGMWEKHPGPVFGWGITGDTEDDNIAWCHVHRREDGFEMHYMGQGPELRSNALPGRAFSSDGGHWEKREPVVESGLTLDDRPMPSTFWRPIYLEDPDEEDPSRRFKGLIGRYRNDRGLELRVWDVITSPDALQWHTVDQPNVVGGDISIASHLYRDEEDPEPMRRYKFLAVTGCNSGRGVAAFTSPNLIHWDRAVYLRENTDDLLSPLCPYPTGPQPIDPDAAENPWEEEVHDAYIWREHGILMFHYDAFYFGANQHIEKALAVSRDGRHYWRVQRGAIDMPHGNCGEWDSGRNRTAVPIRVGDELWIFFCGMPAQFFGDSDTEGYMPPLWVDAWTFEKTRLRQEQRPWRVGLAKLRVDGWAYLQAVREAGCGYLTTIPFGYTGGNLVVNGSGLGPGGIQVEILTAEGLTLDGFGRDRCRFSEPDAVTSRVAWEGVGSLPHGRYRLKFTFEDLESRLYAFGFED